VKTRTAKDISDSLTLFAVTSATAMSTLADCMFETTPRQLVLQGLGGLFDRQGHDKTRPYLVAVYQSREQAVKHATRLLQEAGSSPVDVSCWRCRTRIPITAAQCDDYETAVYRCVDGCRVSTGGL
jgi:recombinational DNA repair protein (RecF pathway)